jgi:hypothetical protein
MSRRGARGAHRVVRGAALGVLALGTALLMSATAIAAAAVPTEPAERVAYHVKKAETIASHFESVLAARCQRFASPQKWEAYFDSEVDRVVLLVAHLEEAWIEAKRTGDDDVRRAAKAPRKRLDEARALLDKLQRCAAENGTSFAPFMVWQRIEQDVPRRQTEIALPR